VFPNLPETIVQVCEKFEHLDMTSKLLGMPSDALSSQVCGSVLNQFPGWESMRKRGGRKTVETDHLHLPKFHNVWVFIACVNDIEVEDPSALITESSCTHSCGISYPYISP
jgi:hypothetical protein